MYIEKSTQKIYWFIEKFKKCFLIHIKHKFVFQKT